jgi:A/G-specific adenine glycosylase
MRQVTSAWLIDRLLAWYDANARKLPWRASAGAPISAYVVLVSEFMLQQTTVATVKARFPVFLARFPDVHALAAADASEVLHAWQGLGYYRRAHALHACAQVIVQRHGGQLPSDEALLRALPGIGLSTATCCVSWRACTGWRPLYPMPQATCTISLAISRASIGQGTWRRR